MALDDAYSKALLHFNGDDESTTFTDESGKTWTPAGSAQIDTAQSVFGGASGLFNGSTDYIYTNDSADWFFDTGDFTIDFRVRFASLPSAGDYMFIYHQRADDNNQVYLALYNDTGTYKWVFSSNLLGAQKAAITRETTISTATWYHIALSRSTNDFMLFQAGTMLGVAEVDADEVPDIGANLEIGRWGGDGYYFDGWIDELRISKGIARWTANFTPPTAEYGAAITVTPPALSLVDTFAAPSINSVFPPYLTETDEFKAPSINTVFPPALSLADTFVVPVYGRTEKPPALSLADTFVVPGYGRVENMPCLQLYDQFHAPLTNVPHDRDRVKVNLV